MTSMLTAEARARLEAIGIPASVARHVTLDEAPPIGDTEGLRAVIAVGYLRRTRYVETATANVPSLEDARETLSNRERIAPLIAMGVQAIPAEQRPDLPQWMIEAAAEPVAALRRARRLAVAAAEGQRRTETSTGPDADAPF